MNELTGTRSFYEQPQVQVQQIALGKGVPLGIEMVSNPLVGVGGAYGTWGEGIDNEHLPALIEQLIGQPLEEHTKMNLSELGFLYRHHLQGLSPAEQIVLELEVGTRFLQAATQACGWQPSEVEGVLIGMTAPATTDFCERIAERAGIPAKAIKVSVHKACDSSVGGLQLALNPDEALAKRLGQDLAGRLYGKKVLVGGIEGLSRFMQEARDTHALQLFGNGAGVFGMIPGETMKFLVGVTHEVYDEEGVLAVRMVYPHSRQRAAGQSMIEVSQNGENHIRVAGLMHEPDNEWPVVMAGPMGMVKLFVRTGAQVLQEVYTAYQRRMAELGRFDKSIALAVVHHANYKINKLLEKNLHKEGIHIPMPWVLSEFGNVSAASNMIAFLRKLTSLKPGDHILFDSFGAGTYYDALAVELGG
jgi:3-oxoacyl-[acyl-carrier-protein] synthase III